MKPNKSEMNLFKSIDINKNRRQNVHASPVICSELAPHDKIVSFNSFLNIDIARGNK